MDQQILFKERQGFKQWWLWMILIFINGFSVWVLIKKYFHKQPFGDTDYHTYSGAEIPIVVVVLVTILFLITKLETVIQTDKIEVRLFPFQLSFKQYPSNTIKSAFVRTYKPLAEYGGWGMRIDLFGKGEALNVYGDQGIQLVFTNGSKLLIGTQKPDEASAILQKAGYLQPESY